jgi:hypothetical protein
VGVVSLAILIRDQHEGGVLAAVLVHRQALATEQ